jgi:CheY-like chemotaxis protein
MNPTPTILLAEDDDGHVILIQNCFRKAGYTNGMVRFHDGEETLKYLMEDKDPARFTGGTSVLVMDINMPKMDGIEVLRRLRCHPVLKAMIIVMVSTTLDPRDFQQCRKLGCDYCVPKTPNWDHFASELAPWVRPGNRGGAANHPLLTTRHEPFHVAGPGFAVPEQMRGNSARV